MLKGIPTIISPALLKVLAEMGHGDMIVLADSSFPAASLSRENNCIYLRQDGCKMCDILTAILKVFPLDPSSRYAVTLMNSHGQPNECDIPIWNDYFAILEQNDISKNQIDTICDRYAFYEQAKNAYCILQTGETAIYSNLILKKGY